MTLKKILKEVKSAESTVSMILGITVVVIVGVILFNYFKSYSSSSQSGKEPEVTQNQEKVNGLPTQYTVVKGDTLWKISEKFYKSGYNWVDISEANQISRPDDISEGQVLTIPNVPVKQQTTAEPTSLKSTNSLVSSKTISGGSYTVVKGDSLWDISVRAYQDGFKWVQIAKANNLAHPDLIHPGNTLVIPR